MSRDGNTPPAPVVVCLTASGLASARAAAAILDAQLHGFADRVEGCETVFTGVAEHLRALFAAGHPIIGVCASGVLIRALAPLLADKRREPPVLALAEDGSAIVPLLGGHRGANDIARKLETGLGRTLAANARAAITTAGDLRLGLALDAPPEGWRLENPEDAPTSMAEAVAGAQIEIEGWSPWIAELAERLDLDCPVCAETDRLSLRIGEFALVYHRQNLRLGLGCERGAEPQELLDLVRSSLDEAGLHPAAVAGVYSIDLKADEAAIHAVAAALQAPARFFSAAELEAQKLRLATPSEIVFQEVGCHGVAEGAALAAAGPDGALLLPKRKSQRATCAITRAGESAEPSPGRSRGRLTVVGIGPGHGEGRTPEASKVIAEAEELVGYGLYIDLLGSLATGKARADFPLGGEEDRCRHALEEAGKGRDVALICSGDGGIYAMGALVMELLDRAPDQGGVTAAARRTEIRMIPGVSALQTASARAGALLGHDFCAVSLSDLLTPWETIEARVEAAARGDFVIAFYNPVSKRRRTQLLRAREILLRHRAPETPVLLARELGRPGEELRRRDLGSLSVDEVDMLTTVLVGSSASRAVSSGDSAAGAEGAWLYTPRGYAKKLTENQIGSANDSLDDG